jgi:hypothetical protein
VDCSEEERRNSDIQDLASATPDSSWNNDRLAYCSSQLPLGYRVEHHTIDSIGLDTYTKYFIDVFGIDEAIEHVPGYILVLYYNDETLGFLSYYIHNSITLYIQYAGYICKSRSRFKSHLKILLDYITNAGWTLLASIYSSNIDALIIAMRCGFQVIGTKIYAKDNVIVEIMKENDICHNI